MTFCFLSIFILVEAEQWKLSETPLFLSSLLSVVTSHLNFEPEGGPLDWKLLIIEGGGTRRHFLLVEVTLLLLFLPNSIFVFLRVDWGCYSLYGVARGRGEYIGFTKNFIQVFLLHRMEKPGPPNKNLFLFLKYLFSVLAFIQHICARPEWLEEVQRTHAYQRFK